MDNKLSYTMRNRQCTRLVVVFGMTPAAPSLARGTPSKPAISLATNHRSLANGMMRMHLHFEWDAKKAASNLRKHGVSFEEAAEVFRDPLALSLLDENHSQSEERWITLGQAGDRKLVVVVHTWREDDSDHIYVRLISARLATSHETQQYEG
ncbi:hypothetical protein D3C85_871960 [compost metagenome]